MAMMRYALVITTFTTSQLNELQKKFIYLLLPKMSLNRHTPRAVIYAPITCGGRGLADLRLEQFLLHFRTNLGHMRRKDNAGKALIATMQATQIESGLSIPFYKSNPNTYDYVTKNTRWRRMWETLFEMDLQLETNIWTPTSKYLNDKNIMEEAVLDNKFQGKNKWKLEVINNCRLYLQCFYIGDLVDEQGRIPIKYLNGTEPRINQHLHMELYRKPPTTAWSMWKTYIVGRFLVGPYKVLPPLAPAHSPLQCQPHVNESYILQAIQSQPTLKCMIESLPNSIKTLLHNIQLPPDNGKAMITSLNTGNLVGSCDGSVKELEDLPFGGFSYSIQDYYTDDNRIFGSCQVPLSNKITSLTSEMYGIIATLLCVYIIESVHYSELTTNDTVNITSDNKQAIKRSKKRPTLLNIGETLVAEYDLWKLIWEIQDSIHARVTFSWIKGHQNELNEKEKIFGPFPRKVQLNIEMDSKAKQGFELNKKSTLYRPLYKETILGIYDKEKRLMTDVRTYVYQKINGQRIHEYMAEKYGWNKTHREYIGWKSLGMAMNTYTEFKKSKVIQLLWDWQNVGRQKEKINDEEGICPLNCKEFETHTHYLACKDPRMIEFQKKTRNKVKLYLDKKNTCPMITKYIIRLLRYGIDSNMITMTTIKGDIESNIHTAIQQQRQLSHSSLEKGLISKHWVKAQTQWENLQHDNHTSKMWERNLIILLHNYSLALWNHRNRLLHGENKKEQKQKQKYQLQQRVQQYYNNSREYLTPQEKRYFSMPIYIRKKQSAYAMRVWCDMVEDIFKQQELRKREKITNWLQLTFTDRQKR